MNCLVPRNNLLRAALMLALAPGLGVALAQETSPMAGPAPNRQPAATALLTGSLTDRTGAVLPHTKLQISGSGSGASSEATAGATTTVTTDGQGNFAVQLPPRTYTVRVTVPDFAPYASPPLHLRAGEPTRLAIRLEVASLAQEVQADNGAQPEDLSDDGPLVFQGKSLDLLSDDNDTLLRQLRALAGAGSGGLQITVNGFSGNALPPKSSIRSIRINSNQYSVYYDSPGFARVDVQTEPGTKEFHGALNFTGTDAPFNARNPYTGAQPPYYQFLTDGNLNGPVNKTTSFFVAGQLQLLANNAVVNAVDPANTGVTLSQALPAPQRTDVYSLRLDHQFSNNNFGFIREAWSQTHVTNSGIAPLVVPTAAFALNTLTNTLQAADTQVLGPHAVNETRFQYLRTRLRQDPNSTAPALIAEGSFIAGGSTTQALRDNQDLYELQDQLEWDHGPHDLRTGLRFREQRDSNSSNANFNGQFVFPSLAAFQITQAGLGSGLSPAQIRAAGGGASQFNLTAGQPAAAVSVADFAVYAEDSWRVRPTLTLSYGLRLEGQTAVPDHWDPAPRANLRWAPRRGKSRVPFVVLGAGYGIFYDRFLPANLVQVLHQNGVNQTGYFVQDPDFYPNVPLPQNLPSSEPTTYNVDPALKVSYQQVASIQATRPLSGGGAVQVRYSFAHGTHGYVLRNSNAPLPGTADQGNPNGGTRPLGAAAGNRYQYAAAANSNSQQFTVLANVPLGKVFLYGEYSLERTYNESTYNPVTGVTSFTANPYNIGADYARSLDSNRHRAELGVQWTLPHGFSLRPYLSAHTGNPFDITTGADNNGDTLYNDRPAFATDLSRASVVRTAYGNFDLNPQPGQTVIPRNYGTDPAFVYLDLTTRYEVMVGPRPAEAPGGGGQPTRPYTLDFQVDAQNLFNHNNPGPPVGVLSSPYFGRSLSLANDFNTFTASNRTILLQCLFHF